MTRRSRIRLLIALVVLGVPLLLVGLVLWYVGSGRLAKRMEAMWAERMPGAMQIDDIRLQGVDAARVAAVRLRDDDGGLLVHIHGVELEGGIVSDDLTSLTIERVELSIADEQLTFVDGLVSAASADEGGRHGSMPPIPTVRIAQLDLQVGAVGLPSMELAVDPLAESGATITLAALAQPGPQLSVILEADGSIEAEASAWPLERDASLALISALGLVVAPELQHLPAGVELSVAGLALSGFEADSLVSGQLRLDLPAPWRGVDHLELHFDESGTIAAPKATLTVHNDEMVHLALTGSWDGVGGVATLSAELDEVSVPTLLDGHWPAELRPLAALDGSVALQWKGAQGWTASADLRLARPWFGVQSVEASLSHQPGAGSSDYQADLALRHLGQITPWAVELDTEEPGVSPLRVAWAEGQVAPIPLLAVLQEAQLIEPLDPGILNILPPQIDPAGSDLLLDLSGAGAISGPLRLAWIEGGLSTDVEADAASRAAHLAELSFAHPAFGRLTGGDLTIDEEQLAFRWRRGEPAASLLGDLEQDLWPVIEALPSGMISIIRSDFPAKARLRLHHDGDQPQFLELDVPTVDEAIVRLGFLDLPSLVRDPRVAAGRLESTEIHIGLGGDEPQPRSIAAIVNDLAFQEATGRIAVGRSVWTVDYGDEASFLDIPEQVALVVEDLVGQEDKLGRLEADAIALTASGTPEALDVTLRMPEVPGSLRFTGDLSAGDLSIDGLDLDTLKERLRIYQGSADEPVLLETAFGGVIDAAIRVQRRDNGGINGQVGRLALRGAHFLDWDIAVDCRAEGVFAYDREQFLADFSGTVEGGQLPFFGQQLDLASLKPAFRFDASRYGNRLDIHRFHVQIEDSDSQVPPALGIEGRYDLLQQTGAFKGVLDRVDLGWLTTNVPWLELSYDKEIAGRATALFSIRRPERQRLEVEGTVFPFSIDLLISGGDIAIRGLNGFVVGIPVQSFRLDGNNVPILETVDVVPPKPVDDTDEPTTEQEESEP